MFTPPPKKKKLPIPIVVALIGFVGTITAAFITGFFSQANEQGHVTFAVRLAQTAEASFFPTEEIVATPEPQVDVVVPVTGELSMLPQIIVEYSRLETPGSESYAVEVQSNKTYVWRYHRCALTRELLTKNLSQMRFTFFVDSREIPQDDFLTYDFIAGRWTCQSWATILTNWQEGSTAVLSVVYKISRPVHDGVGAFQPGEYRHDIVVTVE